MMIQLQNGNWVASQHIEELWAEAKDAYVGMVSTLTYTEHYDTHEQAVARRDELARIVHEAERKQP